MTSRNRVRVYRRGYLWYGECAACPTDERMRSPFLPNTHTEAMRHVAQHRAGVAE